MERANQNRSKRVVKLVEVLVVVAIRAAVAGVMTMVVIPEHNRARVRLAALGAANVREVSWAGGDREPLSSRG